MKSTAARSISFAVTTVVALVAIGGYLFVRHPVATFERIGRWKISTAGLTRHEAAGSRGRLVWWSGGTGPVVILLHGSNDTAGGWARVVKELARGRRLVVPDLPGHGRSEPREGPLPIGDMLAGIDAIVAAEAPSGKVSLVGNSMGGWLALLWAREHPERVDRVVVENGAPVAAGIGKVNMFPKNRKEMRATLEALMGPDAPPFADFVVDDFVRQTKTGSFGRVAKTDLRPYVLDGRLGEIGVPVVLLWGDSDELLPVAYAEALRSGLPNARLEVLPRCGHVSHRECPVKFVAALEKALAP